MACRAMLFAAQSNTPFIARLHPFGCNVMAPALAARPHGQGWECP